MPIARLSAVLCATAIVAVAYGPKVFAAEPAPAPAAPTQRADPAAVERAAARIRALLDQTSKTPGSYPAIAAVAVTGEATPLMYVRGSTRATGGRPVDANSPFYIASQTKSYMGVLAARLDEKGVLSLDTTLDQIWPGLRLPAPVDAKTITLRALLSHQAPLTTNTLNFRTAWLGEIPVREFPALLERYTSSRDPGFSYSNLGYLIYGAALETRTGKSWRDWLKAEVFGPLGLTRTSARTSDFPAAEVPWRHQWSGTEWYAYEPKPDATMHAAGGIVTSPADVARWMQANLARSWGPDRPASRAFRDAHARQSAAELSDGGFACNGYGLGWMICTYHGVDLLVHSGEYDGTRAILIIAPDLGVGYSLMANSDSMTGTLGRETALLFIDLVIGHPDAEARAATIATRYPEGPAMLAASRREAVATARANARWGGWSWRPSPAELKAFEGRYASPRLGEMTVSVENGVLVGRLGAMRVDLDPASPGLFGMTDTPFSEPTPIQFTLGSQGRATELKWNDDVFQRTGG